MTRALIWPPVADVIMPTKPPVGKMRVDCDVVVPSCSVITILPVATIPVVVLAGMMDVDVAP